MKTKTCFECETTKDLQQHHVVPKSLGGTKTITLCYQCHMKVHGRDGKGMDHSRLTKEGIERRKAEGVKMGAPKETLEKARAISQEVRTAKSIRFAENLKQEIQRIIKEDSLKPKDVSLRKMCAKLNSRGVTTLTGKPFNNPTQIKQSLEKINLKLEDLI